jgi:hypothetical protein
LRLLGETIGIDLELAAREKDVGPYRADLLAKDTATDEWVLIENQLERTDHSHLGQLLTYAAGLEAVTIVWVAQRFTEEHRAALDWLNERTDEKVRAFGLEIELWRIGDSGPAPKFNIVSKPNDWTRSVQGGMKRELSGTGQLQLRFWSTFRDYLAESGSSLPSQTAAPVHYLKHSLGRTGIRLCSVISKWDTETNKYSPEIRAEVVMDGPTAKGFFAALHERRGEIEAALGFSLVWRNPESAMMCRLYVRQAADFSREEDWPAQFAWLRERLDALHRVFAPLVRTLAG